MGESDARAKITTATLCRRRRVSAARSTGQRHTRNGAGNDHDGTSTLTVGGGGLAGGGSGGRRGRPHRCPGRSSLVGALICAGAALAPDLDHKAATISRAFGPVSRGLCEIVDKLSLRRLQGDQEAGRPAPLRRPPHPDPHLAVGGADRRGRLGRWRSPAAAGRCWRSSSSTWCWPSRACCGGRPGSQQRRPGLAARRDQRLDPRRRPGQAGQRLGLAVHRSRARSTCGSGCRSCSAPWCTTSATR